MANTQSIVKNIITIDGPSGSGKGTISQQVAQKLGWHMLDSGALYRVLGLAIQRHDIDIKEPQLVANLARKMDISFHINDQNGEVEPILEDENVASLIRTDAAGQAASQVAAIPAVREGLLGRQRDFFQAPGLVADGRDMGTIVFPEAPVKIFLTASAECRAERRFNQLKNKGINASMRALLDSITARDERDQSRTVAPLIPAKDALIIDSSNLSIDSVLTQVLDYASKTLPSIELNA